MRILGVDFESTGLDTAKDRIIEIGAILWDGTGKALRIFSTLVEPDDGFQVPEVITKLTGITTEDIANHGFGPTVALRDLNSLIYDADFVCAHNGEMFDRPLWRAECNRHEINSDSEPWIDTRLDIPWREDVKMTSLSLLAAQHGFLNPFPHRAVFDVATMGKLLFMHDVAAVIESAKQPVVTIVSMAPFEKKDEVKEAGFYWQPQTKTWERRMRKGKAQELVKGLKFQCIIKEA